MRSVHHIWRPSLHCLFAFLVETMPFVPRSHAEVGLSIAHVFARPPTRMRLAMACRATEKYARRTCRHDGADMHERLLRRFRRGGGVFAIVHARGNRWVPLRRQYHRGALLCDYEGLRLSHRRLLVRPQFCQTCGAPHPMSAVNLWPNSVQAWSCN